MLSGVAGREQYPLFVFIRDFLAGKVEQKNRESRDGFPDLLNIKMFRPLLRLFLQSGVYLLGCQNFEIFNSR